MQYHRQCFDHEYTAHHQEHDFLSNDHGNRAKCGAESKRTDMGNPLSLSSCSHEKFSAST